ncbi:MAG: hypothetical protein COA59_10405 [Colwellia sp.]|jgi:hypothetical protein|nr:MAG: hypothetical protein COA59_10405 [Colwellia sp.]
MNDIPLPKAFKAYIDNNRVFISSPATLCIYDKNHSYLTYQFVSLIQDYIIKYNVALTIDLISLKNFTAAASLLLFAKVTKCQMAVKDPSHVEVVFPVDKAVNKMMVDCGLWGGIKQGGISKIRRLIDSNNQYLSGSENILESYGKILPATLINLVTQGVKFSNPNTVLFTKGIQEAILNVKYHAYDFSIPTDFYKETGEGRWWQCCWLDKPSNQLIFIIYDDGKGITNSLRKFYHLKKVDVSDIYDHQLIEKAMEAGFTRTEDHERGKGSSDIIKTACVFPNSHLIVMSGKGLYRHDCNGVNSEELPFKMEGTLIQWVLNYNEEKNNDYL